MYIYIYTAKCHLKVTIVWIPLFGCPAPLGDDEKEDCDFSDSGPE